MQITYETRIISDSLNRQHAQQYEMVLLCNATESVYYSPEAKNYYTRSDKTAGIVTTAELFRNIPKQNTASINLITRLQLFFL
ncbi:hypothetical protein EJ377_14580 [Chryseobacterium arthrosphaerae]|uniref:Uncharacterized protein n=1 Tax=Chryseobacterium arthrosphaerae TaxID=651561 RepID=A0A432DS17_9FLAO|nr:hypothetical protein EJ377_14580 [Chryseobacterium arthrosphaerae]